MASSAPPVPSSSAARPVVGDDLAPTRDQLQRRCAELQWQLDELAAQQTEVQRVRAIEEETENHRRAAYESAGIRYSPRQAPPWPRPRLLELLSTASVTSPLATSALLRPLAVLLRLSRVKPMYDHLRGLLTCAPRWSSGTIFIIGIRSSRLPPNAWLAVLPHGGLLSVNVCVTSPSLIIVSGARDCLSLAYVS